jgi:F-box domain.
VLSCIFNLLYITPCPSFSNFDFGHDYEGAAATHKPYGRPLPINLSSPLYADPSAIPSLEHLESYCSETFSSNSPVKNVVLDLHAPTSNGLGYLLGKLPLELLYHILSFLPVIQVAHLRLVSRHFALIAKRKHLPHSFWRSRFRGGGEQGFICPDLSAKRDWYRLFFSTRAYLQTENAALTNRKRIWTLLESITTLIERKGIQKLLGSEIYPEAGHKWVRRLDTVPSDDLPSTFQGIYSLSGKLASGSHQLTDGCRAQQFRLIGRSPSFL